jgi:hypothetical protein
MKSERWFTAAELEGLSRPTMDRAIEALDAGDIATARRLCADMRHEWRFLHDAMAEMILGLVTFVQRRCGEDALPDAWEESLRRGWREDAGRILARDRRDVVQALAATWRAHSTSGVGPQPGAFTIEEDDEKFTFRMHPCGSGQRLWQLGKYDGEDAYGVTERAHDWSFDRAGFPLYCTHCAFLNELLPIKWYGLPLYPSEPPEDFDRDPCVWYWYKDPADIPRRYWARYGLEPPPPSGGSSPHPDPSRSHS